MPVMPNANVPIADPNTGIIDGAWQNFFQLLAGRPGPSKVVPASGSPYLFTAPSGGSLVIQGTVTALSVTRGRDVVALDPSLRLIPLGAGDGLLITYSAAPGLVFLPS